MKRFTGFRRLRLWHGALALVVAGAVTAGLLWWHPWAPGEGQKPMQFTTAAGDSPRFGTGEHLYRYKVRAENGIAESPGQFATEVDAVLGNVQYGWAAGGTASFQRMPADPVDFTVYLATPETTDRICGQYGLDTGGTVNCGVGHQVVINLKRWTELSEFYVGKPEALPRARRQPRGRPHPRQRPRRLPGRGRAGTGDDAADQGPARLRPERLALLRHRHPAHRPARPGPHLRSLTAHPSRPRPAARLASGPGGRQRTGVQYVQPGHRPGHDHIEAVQAARFGLDDGGGLQHDHMVVLKSLDQRGR